jgi:predicted acetyltransferase
LSPRRLVVGRTVLVTLVLTPGVLLTCATDNEPSRRIILANGGVYDARDSAQTASGST